MSLVAGTLADAIVARGTRTEGAAVEVVGFRRELRGAPAGHP